MTDEPRFCAELRASFPVEELLELFDNSPVFQVSEAGEIYFLYIDLIDGCVEISPDGSACSARCCFMWDSPELTGATFGRIAADDDRPSGFAAPTAAIRAFLIQEIRRPGKRPKFYGVGLD